MRNSYSKEQEKKIALDHVHAMFLQAEEYAKKDLSVSNKLVKNSLSLLMKFQLPVPKEYKNKFCKNCKNYFIHGENCRVRTRNNKLIYTCFKCKSYIKKNINPKK